MLVMLMLLFYFRQILRANNEYREGMFNFLSNDIRVLKKFQV